MHLQPPPLRDAADAIRRAQTIMLMTHVSPDADAVGSLLGLTLALRAIDKRAMPASSEDVPAHFKILPGYDAIVQTVAAQPDLLIALDCGDRERMGQLVEAAAWRAAPTLNIDHHITNTHFGDVNWVEPAATSTCEMALRLIDHMQIGLTPEIATNLLYGIVGDTLGFRTPHTTPAALACAMRLMEAGADLPQIMDHQFNRRSYAQMQLWSMALNAMVLEQASDPQHAHVIWTRIDKPGRRRLSLPESGSHGLSNFLLGVEEADVAAVLVEKDNGEIDVSLRARAGFDVAQVALALGGGGHALASGITLRETTLDAACTRVVSALKLLTPTG
jgi:phosphoesterase RecJ-like protein